MLERMPSRTHREAHRRDRVGWLRAGVLGAQDGIVSTASLLIGVTAASGEPHRDARGRQSRRSSPDRLSMAAGEYGSVSSQRDTELADIEKETRELDRYPEHELDELTEIYEGRGLDRALARTVAEELTESDPLGSHVRDELGIVEETKARPVQAAVVSAASFAVGAGLAVLISAVAPVDVRIAVDRRRARSSCSRCSARSAPASAARHRVAPRSASPSAAASPWLRPPSSACSSAPSPDRLAAFRRRLHAPEAG